MTGDIEVHIDFAPGLRRVGTLHRQAHRGSEALSFEYHPAWLAIGIHTTFCVNILSKSLLFPSLQRRLGSRFDDNQPARKLDSSLRWGDEFLLIASRWLFEMMCRCLTLHRLAFAPAGEPKFWARSATQRPALGAGG